MLTRADDFIDATEESFAAVVDVNADAVTGLNHPMVARRFEAFRCLEQVEPQVRLVLAESRFMEHNV